MARGAERRVTILSVVIPAYNEARFIGTLLERIKAAVAFIHLSSARWSATAEAVTKDGQRRQVAAYQRHARASLDALRAAADGHPFWQKIAQRQEERLSEAAAAWNELVSSGYPTRWTTK